MLPQTKRWMNKYCKNTEICFQTIIRFCMNCWKNVKRVCKKSERKPKDLSDSTFPKHWLVVETLSKCQLSVVWSMRLFGSLLQNLAEETARPVGQEKKSKETVTSEIRKTCFTIKIIWIETVEMIRVNSVLYNSKTR